MKHKPYTIAAVNNQDHKKITMHKIHKNLSWETLLHKGRKPNNLSLEYLSKRRSKTKRRMALLSKDSALVQESENTQERMIQSDDLQMGDGSLYIQVHHVNCHIQVVPLNRAT
jgi:hypothetical protein